LCSQSAELLRRGREVEVRQLAAGACSAELGEKSCIYRHRSREIDDNTLTAAKRGQSDIDHGAIGMGETAFEPVKVVTPARCEGRRRFFARDPALENDTRRLTVNLFDLGNKLPSEIHVTPKLLAERH
jgi:hypothetical protein